MVSRQETSSSTFALSFTFVTMDVRGSRDLEGPLVAMDTDPRCVHALGMDKRLGFPDLEGLRLAMDADPRGLLPSAWIASYFPHPGRAGVAGPPNRLAPRSIAKVAVLLIEIAVFQQILCSPPFGSPFPTPPGAGTWGLLPNPHALMGFGAQIA